MKLRPLNQSLAVPTPNGFHVYQPGSTGHAVFITGERECVVCFVALSGSFFLNKQKIKESEFCFTKTGPEIKILIREKPSHNIPPELLILNPGAEILAEQEIPLPETPKRLPVPALKSIAAVLKQQNHSTASGWMNQLLIRSFVYSTRLPDEKQKPKISWGQIKTIQHELQGLNTRGKSVSAGIPACRQLYHQTPKKLQHEKIMASAMEDLMHSAKTLDRLARESGYRSREFFITAFKEHFGVTPASLRNSFRALNGFSP